MNLASDACVRVRRHFFWVPDSLDRASSSTKLPRLRKRAFRSAGHPSATVEITKASGTVGVHLRVFGGADLLPPRWMRRRLATRGLRYLHPWPQN